MSATIGEWAEHDLDQLAPIQRVDYVACELRGRTIREQAERRSVGAGTVGRNVSRAKRRLG